MIHFLLIISNANVSEISDDEAMLNSFQSESIKESKEIEKRDGNRDGHRKIHIITVKKVNDVKQKGKRIRFQLSMKIDNL